MILQPFTETSPRPALMETRAFTYISVFNIISESQSQTEPRVTPAFCIQTSPLLPCFPTLAFHLT